MTANDTIPFDQQKIITKNIIDESKISDELEEMRELTGSSSVIRWCLENSADNFKDWCFINDSGDLDGPYAEIFKQ
ncbi:MAG: hypothetical protein GTO02_07575, partial [Candidatus Dadabacteria bacterium]|nr:hypothetical protein [Candidatus Dadabacteria bacterium]